MGRPLPLLYQSFQPPHLQALERVSLQSSDICVCKLLSIWHIFDGELPTVGQDNLNSLLTGDYWSRGHLDKFDQSDYGKITINSKKVGCRPSSSS